MNKLRAFESENASQEMQYTFPYHYIPHFINGHFSQHLYLRWGYRYICGIKIILKLLKKEKFNSLIDVGCGDGRLLYEVNNALTDKRLSGIDCSEQAIRLAKALNPSLRFKCTDVCFDNSQKEEFDVAVSSEVLEHIPVSKVDDFVKGLSGYLKTGGSLILTVPYKNKPLQAKHYQHFDPQILRAVLGSVFEIEEVMFLEKKSPIFSRLSTYLLNNRLFTLNNQMLLDLFFKLYEKYFFHCKEEQCTRMLILARKK